MFVNKKHLQKLISSHYLYKRQVLKKFSHIIRITKAVLPLYLKHIFYNIDLCISKRIIGAYLLKHKHFKIYSEKVKNLSKKKLKLIT